MPAPPPYHPLRRVSTGSLSGLARSQDRPQSATSGLEFLHAALTDMADEAATLSTNLERLNGVYDALGKFNEGFAAYLYALKMNAFCIDWSNVRLGGCLGGSTRSAAPCRTAITDSPSHTRRCPTPTRTRACPS